tara:strand:+ start:177 stop:1400 length:1224 start_codon:yes stop_codon:yes gene_type:complete
MRAADDAHSPYSTVASKTMAAVHAPPKIPDSYICPITSELMADPVSTADGFTYEREAILEWLRGGNTTSPITGATLARNELIPNHALRSAIQQFVESFPQLKDQLYQERTPEDMSNRIAAKSNEFAAAQQPLAASAAAEKPPPAVLVVSAEPVQPGMEETPVTGPVPMGIPVTALSVEDIAHAVPFAVADWGKLKVKEGKKKSGGGMFGFGGGGAKPAAPPASGVDVSISEGIDPSHLTLRGKVAGLGGAALEVGIGTEPGFGTFAHMLAAQASAPVGILELKTHESVAPGTDRLTEGHAYGLLLRSLGGAPCLRKLRELSISRLSLPTAAAVALVQALHGHPTLETLELWNVELDDEGGMAVARFAAGGSCPALNKLTLGRHLLGPATIRAIEEMLDGSAVRVSLY